MEINLDCNLIQIWSKQINKSLSTHNMRAQWYTAKHRARVKRMLYSLSYLPSISKHLDMDGNLCIKWSDGKEVALDMQGLVDYVLEHGKEDHLARRQSGMVLEAIKVANCPDPFAGLFWQAEKAVEVLARYWE